jgi:hypothetical protein
MEMEQFAPCLGRDARKSRHRAFLIADFRFRIADLLPDFRFREANPQSVI